MNFIPPSEALSNNTSWPPRYNLNIGAVFNISCRITHSSDAFTLYFYKDGVVIGDGVDLVNTTLTVTNLSSLQQIIQLQFLNFQPVHDGVYHCSANTSDTNETEASDLYLYGSGEDCLVHVHRNVSCIVDSETLIHANCYMEFMMTICNT